MEDSLTPAAAAPADKGVEPDLSALKRMVQDWQSLTAEARRQSQTDGDYYHGYQLTEAERRTLRKRRQPDGIFNRVRMAVNGTLGVIKQGASDPQAYPRNPQDEQSADVASKTLRFSADESNFAATKIDFAWDYLVPGTGAVIVEVDADLRVRVEQIRWEEFVYDPRARRQDFADGKYRGVAKWQYVDDVALLYPDAKDELDAAVATGSFLADDVSQDRPTNGSMAWCDRRQRRILVIEIYYRDGPKWIRAVFHSGGVLEADVSPYLDEKKRPCCPIEAQSCYVDRENNRYGVVRDMRAPQDEFNKRRQKLLHLTTVRQIQPISDNVAEVDINIARAEAARPDGVIPAGYQIVPTTDLVSGQAQLLAESAAEMERMSPNPAILGRQGENQSGRANLVRQQAGLTEQAIVLAGVDEWELRVFRQMWNRQRQYWTAPDWIRTTDDEDAVKFIGINQPKPHPATGQPMFDQAGKSVLGYDNALAELDVDIIIDRTQDTANLQQEQFQTLSELAKVGALGPNAGELLLRASSLPDKQRLLDSIKSAPTPEQQEAQQLQLRGAAAKVAKDEADVDKTKSETAKNLAETQNTRVETAMMGGPPPQPMLGAGLPPSPPMPAAGVPSGVPPFAGAQPAKPPPGFSGVSAMPPQG